MLKLLFTSAALVAFANAQCQVSQYQDPATNQCVNYQSPEEKVYGEPGVAVDSGNTAFVLLCGALVLIMTPGLGLFYAGLYKSDSASNIMMKAMMSLSICTMQWIFFGYSFAFGPGSAFFGSFQFADYRYVEKNPSGVYGGDIPHVSFAFFQNMFSAITPALIVGSIVGRMRFWPCMLFILIWTTIIYDPLAHWIWSMTIDPNTWLPIPLGWLAKLGAIDFAGGTVIEVSSGFSGLAACLVLGKRHSTEEEVKPHNQSLVLIGTSFLWFGWIGFNAGSAGAANGIAAIAAMNTNVAACAGFISWVIIESIFEKKVTLVGGCTGAVAAMVAITPGAGYVWPWASVFFGIFPCIFGYLFIRVKHHFGYDDTLDAFAIHGIGGVVGLFLTGLFASQDVNPNIAGGLFYGNPALLGYQVIAILVSTSFSFVGTLIILVIMKYTIGIKVSSEEEIAGMDRVFHGGPSYAIERGEETTRLIKALNEKLKFADYVEDNTQRVNIENKTEKVE